MMNQADHVAQQLHRVLPEFVESYLLIAETIDGEPLARFCAPTKEHAERINRIVFAIAAAGGVRVEEQKEEVGI